MNLEIERKWLIESIPKDIDLSNWVEFEQGYFAIDYDPQIRIRKSGESYELTVKLRLSELERDECNVPIDQKQYSLLRPMTDGKRLKKRRYLIPFGDYTIELDVYQEDLEGLMVAEVEFESVEQANNFKAPDWFGADISQDQSYSNRQLAASGTYPGKN